MKILNVLFIVLLFASCAEDAPTQIEGKAEISLTAMWEKPDTGNGIEYSLMKNAKVIFHSEYGASVEFTDDSGKLNLTNIPSSTYSFSVRGTHPDDSKILIVGNIADIEVKSGTAVSDTIFAKAVSSTGIAINELYTVGPDNNINYVYDQYIELYNSSDTTRYLDGMIVMRFSGNGAGLGQGADEHADDDLDGVTYCFKFPGEPGEKNHPFLPGEFIVLAQDAVDHTGQVPTSVDLSNADWEFFNQLSAIDIDNPNVKNLINIRLDKETDFMVGLTSDVIMIADGTDSEWEDGIDVNTILDGVEYQTKASSRITLDDRVDRGWVQTGIKYSGQSMQRRDPGVDTNDGTLDWEVIPTPTPGYHK